MFKLRPKLIFVLYIVVQLYIDKDYSVSATRVCFPFFHLFVTEDEVFQRFGNLFLYLVRCSTRVNRHYQSLSYCK